MTSTTERYRAATSQSASTVEKIADFWTQGSKKLTDYVPTGLPQVDLVPIVERYFEFVQRTVDISRDLTIDRKSTRLNSSHSQISYAVFCLKKKKDIVSMGELQRTLHACYLSYTRVYLRNRP